MGTRDYDLLNRALTAAIATHGTTIGFDSGAVERPTNGEIIDAAEAYYDWLTRDEPDVDEGAAPPPLVHPERAVLVKLYGIGQAMYEARAATGDETLIRALESLRDASIAGTPSPAAVHPLVALQLADLVDVLRWALNEAEPF